MQTARKKENIYKGQEAAQLSCDLQFSHIQTGSLIYRSDTNFREIKNHRASDNSRPFPLGRP